MIVCRQYKGSIVRKSDSPTTNPTLTVTLTLFLTLTLLLAAWQAKWLTFTLSNLQTIEQTLYNSLTWTQKLTVHVARKKNIKKQKLKQTNDSAHLSQYRFTIREGSEPVRWMCLVLCFVSDTIAPMNETPSHLNMFCTDCHITPLFVEDATPRTVSCQLRLLVHLFVNFTSNYSFR